MTNGRHQVLGEFVHLLERDCRGDDIAIPQGLRMITCFGAGVVESIAEPNIFPSFKGQSNS